MSPDVPNSYHLREAIRWYVAIGGVGKVMKTLRMTSVVVLQRVSEMGRAVGVTTVLINVHIRRYGHITPESIKFLEERV